MRCTSQPLRLAVVILSDTWHSLGSPGGAQNQLQLWQAAGVWPHPDHDPWQAMNDTWQRMQNCLIQRQECML